MKRWLLTLALLPSLFGCAPDKGGGSSAPAGDVFNYGSGTYNADVASSFTDSEGADEDTVFSTELLIVQDGPAATLAGILLKVDAGGFVSSYSYSMLTWYGTYVETVEGYTEADPMVLYLNITGEYPDWSYDYTYEYVITLGDVIE